MPRLRRPSVALAALTLALTLAAEGGAQAAASEPVGPATADDPWEALNREVWHFNTALDRYAFGPIAHGYMRVAPLPVRRSLGSAVDNLREPRTTLNALAQGRPTPAARSAGRFLINSTVGLLGFIDVASHNGLPADRADFGQTLGRYNVAPGPYLMLPILGPYTLRDASGRLVDALLDPVSWAAGGVNTSFGATRLAAVALDYRAGADPALRALDDATDPYVTLRSAVLQQRAQRVAHATGAAEALPDFDAPPR